MILFTAVVLDDSSSQELLEWFPGTLHKKQLAHHMTIQFKPTDKQVVGTPFDVVVNLKVVGYAGNDKVQAVAVSGYESSNAVAHITVATNGSPAKLSNELLEAGFTSVDDGPTLRGTIRGVKR